MTTLGALVKPGLLPVPASLVVYTADLIAIFITACEQGFDEPYTSSNCLAMLRHFMPKSRDFRVRDGLILINEWNMGRGRVLERPLFEETQMYKELLGLRKVVVPSDEDSSASSKKRKRAAESTMGLRKPDGVLVAITSDPNLPFPTAGLSSGSERSHVSPISRVSNTSRASVVRDRSVAGSSNPSTSVSSIVRCPFNQTMAPGFIYEFKPARTTEKVKKCLAKTAMYSIAAFEMSGAYLSLAMTAEHFSRLATVFTRHLVLEVPSTFNLAGEQPLSFAALLRRTDIILAMTHVLSFLPREIGATSVDLQGDQIDSVGIQNLFAPITLVVDYFAALPASKLLHAIPHPSADDQSLLWRTLRSAKSFELADADIGTAAYHSDDAVYQKPPVPPKEFLSAEFVDDSGEDEEQGPSGGDGGGGSGGLGRRGASGSQQRGAGGDESHEHSMGPASGSADGNDNNHDGGSRVATFLRLWPPSCDSSPQVLASSTNSSVSAISSADTSARTSGSVDEDAVDEDLFAADDFVVDDFDDLPLGASAGDSCGEEDEEDDADEITQEQWAFLETVKVTLVTPEEFSCLLEEARASLGRAVTASSLE